MNDFERQYAIRLPNGELFTYPKPNRSLCCRSSCDHLRPHASLAPQSSKPRRTQ